MTKRAVVTIGDQVRSRRLKLGLSQYQLAVDAGVRPEVISRLERGRSNSSLASLYKIVPVLGMSIEELTRDQQATIAKKKPVKKGPSK